MWSNANRWSSPHPWRQYTTPVSAPAGTEIDHFTGDDMCALVNVPETTGVCESGTERSGLFAKPK